METSINSDIKGAYVIALWNDDESQTAFEALISFGEYDENKEPVFDSFGFRDDEVFFHTTEEDFFKLYLKGSGEDFRILSHSFIK